MTTLASSAILLSTNGIGGPPVWTQLAPSGTPPPARQTAAGAYDVVTNRLTTFGGLTPAAAAGRPSPPRTGRGMARIP